MRHLISVLTTAALVTAGLLLVASPAQADTRCITQSEYRRIDSGDSLRTVRRIVGAPGRVAAEAGSSWDDEYGFKMIEFRQCGRSWNRSSVSVTFDKSEYERHEYESGCQYGYFSGCSSLSYSYTVTYYGTPYVVSSKAAFWW